MFDELPSWVQEVSLWEVLLTIALVTWMIKRVIKSLPGIKNFIIHMEHLGKLPEMYEMLEKIQHEVFPNSGGSLRDAVDAHGAQLQELKESIKNKPPEKVISTVIVEGQPTIVEGHSSGTSQD